MSGEQKAFLLLVAVVIVCMTILYCLLFLALWQYKEWVAVSLLFALAILLGVFIRGKLNEQELRRARYRHQEETPLNPQGEPVYWPKGAQENPNHVRLSCFQTSYDNSYQSQPKGGR